MSSDSTRNPFKRGKSLVLSNLILEGKTNREIEDYYIGMGFDKKYGSLNNSLLYQVRSELKKAGLLNAEGFVIKTQSTALPKPAETQESDKLKGVEEDKTKQIGEGNKEIIPSITRRPDWDLLSIDQINQIGDPKLRMDIMNYKTEIEKLKQELKPEYATRGEIDLLRNEVVTQIGGIEGKINTLLSKFEDASDKDNSEGEEEAEEEENEEVITPAGVVSTENPLAGKVDLPKTKSGEGLIEVEKGVIVTKLIGLWSKTLMWFELDKAGGILPNGEPFPGNLADYINACVEDVHSMRNIELSMTQRRKVG